MKNRDKSKDLTIVRGEKFRIHHGAGGTINPYFLGQAPIKRCKIIQIRPDDNKNLVVDIWQKKQSKQFILKEALESGGNEKSFGMIELQDDVDNDWKSILTYPENSFKLMDSMWDSGKIQFDSEPQGKIQEHACCCDIF